MLLQLLVKKEWLYEDLTCQLVLEELSILNENDDDEDFPPPVQNARIAVTERKFVVVTSDTLRIRTYR